MRAKTYYLIRCLLFAALAIAAPIWAYSSSVGLRGWQLIIAEGILLGLAGLFFWRYRAASAEEKIHYGPAPETIARMAKQRSRLYALLPLAGAALLVALELYTLRNEGKLHIAAVLLTPTLLLLGLGGLVNPDVVFGARPDVPDIPDGVRRVARLLTYGGLAIGLLACWYLFWR
jgi:hypothetical protein